MIQRAKREQIPPSVPSHMEIGGKPVTGRSLLTFMFYAFGLLHYPRPNQVQDFRTLIQTCGKEHVMMAFHMPCSQIVIGQDFRHWIDKGCIAPDRISISEVLGDIGK